MRKKLLIGAVFACTFVVNIFADNVQGVPTEPGSALIIYNALGYSGYEFSQGAMETFRAALDQDVSHIKFAGASVSGGIPDIDPPLKMVDVINCTSSNGFDGNLQAFANTLTGENKTLFDSLYNAGNPLAYWSQVYDLRFVNNGGNNNSVISLGTAKTSDYSYYKEHLKSGGALYIQAEYNIFTARNNSIINCIKDFTKDKGFQNGNIAAGSNMSAFSFSNEFENFATDFNDLSSLHSQYPMTWVMAGGYPTSEIASGKTLVANGSNSIIIIWGTQEMDPDIGNGRLIVSFDINAWSDWNEGRITRATMGVIQNMYDLMSGTRQFGVYKEFSKQEAEIGDIVKCSISIKNNATYKIGAPIVDTLSTCFKYIEGSGDMPTEKTVLPDGRTVLKWSIGEVAGRSEKSVSFDVQVLNTDCN